ncbi:MAG: hypothetical protein DWQ34_21445 [Planctomycetota bacterium]|nr:MAG: hypothetical protein DWQ29_10990 [Planctomycetota bacterium]REJ88831.1 MAG: hypothetical protein DWQ34_21445 [Planctomycetota bacterium]REK29465.1 MAG: hypothetical protein DWQ41_04110 [Planctomycetota bacterium]REK31830.1 MAG: hypothetical protein DWQ45_18360 [Planctomycetota bacterium]
MGSPDWRFFATRRGFSPRTREGSQGEKYIVRLPAEERRQCQVRLDKLKGTSRKVKRANVLRKADADGLA